MPFYLRFDHLQSGMMQKKIFCCMTSVCRREFLSAGIWCHQCLWDLFSANWCLLKDIYLLSRYYLVEKAKDANIVGILVSTLGVGTLYT